MTSTPTVEQPRVAAPQASRRPTPPRRGFTLTDLAITVALVGLVTAVALPVAAFRSRDQANRIRCASNLRQIGLAMMMYANDNKGNFPRTYFDPASANVIADTTGYDSSASFARAGQPSPVGDNNVCASFFLTLKTQDITPETYICPDSDGERGFTATDVQSHSNWQSIPLNLSYSYQVPFPAESARKVGLKFNNTLSSDFAIAGDINPGGQAVLSVPFNAPAQAMRPANSPNHYGQGQNILYADGHCEWQVTPYCGSPRPAAGVPRDNVYTYVADPGTGRISAGILGQPADQYDTILLPAYNGPARTGGAAVAGMQITGWACVGGGVFLLIVIAAVTTWLIVRKPNRPPVAGLAPAYYAPGPGQPPPPGQ